MSSPIGLRGYLSRYLPSWLADNYPASPSYGYRFLWSIALMVDAAIDVVMQGALSAVGRGTPTALEYIGQARGLIRNQGESDADYARRLATWIDRAKENGSSYRLAVAIHDYLASHPRVRAITRSGIWGTVAPDGTVTRREAPWDWDSVSHPERNDPDEPWWSDIWIVVDTPWAKRSGTLDDLTGDDGYAWDHMATHAEVDALKGLVAQLKSAHTCVRAVIWTSDPDLFDPEEPLSCPNGRWGAWGILDGTSYVPSDRNWTSCVYWEPR